MSKPQWFCHEDYLNYLLYMEAAPTHSHYLSDEAIWAVGIVRDSLNYLEERNDDDG